MSHLENYNTKTDKEKLKALMLTIEQEEIYLSRTSNPMKLKRRIKYIKILKKRFNTLKQTT